MLAYFFAMNIIWGWAEFQTDVPHILKDDVRKQLHLAGRPELAE